MLFAFHFKRPARLAKNLLESYYKTVDPLLTAQEIATISALQTPITSHSPCNKDIFFGNDDSSSVQVQRKGHKNRGIH